MRVVAVVNIRRIGVPALLGLFLAALTLSSGSLSARAQADPPAPVSGAVAADELPRRGMLGVRVAAVPDDVRVREQLARREGVLVEGLTPDAPAEREGIAPGDVVNVVVRTANGISTLVHDFEERGTASAPLDDLRG